MPVPWSIRSRALVPWLVCAAIVAVTPAEARRALGEGEMDGVTASGPAVVTDAGLSPMPADGSFPSALVINYIVGDNQVLTRFRLGLGGPGDLLQPPGNGVLQQRDLALPDAESHRSMKLVLSDGDVAPGLRRDVLTAVVNNIIGSNQIATLINAQLGILPAGAVAIVGTGLGPVDSGGTRTDSGTGSIPGSPGGNPDTIEIGGVTYALPNTLAEAVKFFEALAPRNPEFAAELGTVRNAAAQAAKSNRAQDRAHDIVGRYNSQQNRQTSR